MSLWWVRLFFLPFILLFLYHSFWVMKGSALILSVIQWGLCFFKSRHFGKKEAILHALVDKIFWGSVLIVWVDQKILHAGFVAWVIGVDFVLSGMDLLDESFRPVRGRGTLQMVLVMLFLILIAFQTFISLSLYQNLIAGLSGMWIFFSIALLLKSLFSNRFKNLLREA
ncbi:MAG: hypothetical protein HYS08_05875 [Chlamydiae bacterium]|nr:hypothetical protein [Chlamydiota bacterium]MBI3265756.1 hypothetical protein [Chlamydiota bacterium]